MDKRPQLHPLTQDARDTLLAGLADALDERWLDRIWEMIWRRWQAYENLCHQG